MNIKITNKSNKQSRVLKETAFKFQLEIKVILKQLATVV